MSAEQGAQEWQAALKRLQERYPSIAAERVQQALRDACGHAGIAARELREQTVGAVKEHDADDVEHVKTLLSSPAMFKHACQESFQAYDKNGDGVLDWKEVCALTGSLYFRFGFEQPPDHIVRAFFDSVDENRDGVLSEREFRKFFESFLRHAFFDPKKLQRIVDKSNQAVASSSPKRGGHSRPRSNSMTQLVARET